MANFSSIKTVIVSAVTLLIFLAHGVGPSFGKCKSQRYDSTQFKSERVRRTDSIILNGDIRKVFPLFGAFEERKWAEGWNPTLVYMAKDIIEEGTTFKTKGHGFGEAEFIWRINKYEPKDNLIQYLVTTSNRHWTITVKCRELSLNKTQAVITYTFTGLNETGNHLDRHSLDKMYEHHLKDWEEAINTFLNSGKPVKND